MVFHQALRLGLWEASAVPVVLWWLRAKSVVKGFYNVAGDQKEPLSTPFSWLPRLVEDLVGAKGSLYLVLKHPSESLICPTRTLILK